MPGVERLGWRHGLIDTVREAKSNGVNQVVIFPKVHTTRMLLMAYALCCSAMRTDI